MPIARDILEPAILHVLKVAAAGKGLHPHYLTAYQILKRLPDDLRTALIDEYGEPGRDAGKNFTSVSRVAQVAREIADYDYMDAVGLAFEFDEGEVSAGNAVIGVYRARR